MLALILSVVFTIILFFTFGSLLTKWLQIRSDPSEILVLGLVFCNTLTSIISLFFPIDHFVISGFIATSVFTLLFLKKEIKIFYNVITEKKLVVLIAFPFVLIAFLISLTPPEIYDTGLYHLQSIKWIKEFPVVPGLANLHTRFGFNPNVFTLHSLITMEDIFKQKIFPVHLALFTILTFYFVNRLVISFYNKGIANSFVLHFILFCVLLGSNEFLPSVSPDYFTLALPIFIFARIIQLDQQKGVKLKSFLPVFLISVYLLTVKLSVLPILILYFFIFYKFKNEIRTLSFSIGLALIIIILPWLVRNVILTGWLLFPFPNLDLFEFDWKVPQNNVINLKDTITGWARKPEKGHLDAAAMSISSWFPDWWRRITIKNRLFFMSGLLFPILILLFQKILKPRIIPIGIVITAFCGILFWFYMAPDLRFGKAFLLIASISPLLFLRFNWIPRTPNIIGGFVFLILIFCYGRMAKNHLKHYSPGYAQIITPMPILVPPDLEFKRENLGKTEVFVPLSGDRCFDHSIPCAPPSTNLTFIELRGTSLIKGFRPVND